MSNLALGIDPSHSTTGLALVAYNTLGCVTEIVASMTSAPFCMGDITLWLDETVISNISYLTIEAGFVKKYHYTNRKGKLVEGETRHAGIEVSKIGGVCAGLCNHYCRFELDRIDFLMATEWRPLVFGSGSAQWDTDTAKKNARLLASQIRGYDPKMSEHVCEAIAIAQAGITKGVKQ